MRQVIVLNTYFTDAIMAGQKQTIMTENSTLVPNLLLQICNEKNEKRIPIADAIVLHSAPLNVFFRTKCMMLANVILSREESQLILKNEGFKKESDFWDAYTKSHASFNLVRIDITKLLV